jgi:hypothetical protein
VGDTDSAAVGPALEQEVGGPTKRSKKMDDDMTGYGRRWRGVAPPQGNSQGQIYQRGDDDGDEDDGVDTHPKVDHNGHHVGATGMCPGCGSKRCMGGCGGGKRM